MSEEINFRSLGICSPGLLNRRFTGTTVIGAGGIGSSAVVALAKMGLRNMTVWDDDVLEIHNIGNQFLPYAHEEGNFLGRKKTNALGYMLNMLIPEHHTKLFGTRFAAGVSAPSSLTICTVDTMSTRKAIWKHVVTDERCQVYIDARMGAQTLRIFTVDLLDIAAIDAYEETLYSDEDALEEPCTERGIVYTSMFAGAVIANTVKRLAAGPTPPPFELDFIIEHDMIITRNG